MALVAVVLTRSGSSGDEAGCDDAAYLADEEARLCYVVPEGWQERSPTPVRDVPVSSMITSGGDGGSASAMAGDWQVAFGTEPPGDTMLDAAVWLADESGLAGSEHAGLEFNPIVVDDHDAATAWVVVDGDPAVQLRATVVAVDEDRVAFLVTLNPNDDYALHADTRAIHGSLAVPPD